ncbi:MAG: hypothetical protein WBY94_09410 [Polyangiaceae bacterium]
MKRFAAALLGLVAGCGGLVVNGVEDASDEASSAPAASLDSGAPIDASPSVDAGSSRDASNDALASDAPPSSDAGSEGDSSDAATNGLPSGCEEAGVPPPTLECTGLYSDFASQTLSPTVQAYAPAVPLWSDGAVKERWIELPPGQKIDATNPSEWTFPVGTKLFKQFTYEGRRVETRLFQKTAVGFWVHATYEWNADQTATTISYGDTVPVDADGGTWVIPTPDDCDSCHRGRSDRILGFEQVLLGLAGATGLTLPALVAQNLITPVPALVNLTVGDDGTGLAAPALSWLHVNCGVSCHNANENAQAYGAMMILRLDPAVLDGSQATASWNPLRTTIGVPCVSGAVQGVPRIVAGDPGASAIVQLVSMRGVLQMPPIGTRFVDTTDVTKVVDWIQHMPSDAGAADAGLDVAAIVEGGYATTAPDGGYPTEGGATGSQDSGADATVTADVGAEGGASGAENEALDATVEAAGGDASVADDQAAMEDGGSD